ncbi:hypothetical protein JCM19992_02180 [Thermostilla marina]
MTVNDRREVSAVKQITAVVQPFVAERVLRELAHAPLEACLVREVKGFGRQKNYLEEYRGGEYEAAFLPKVQIDLWVDDYRLEETLRLIVTHARTGRMGAGKIFVVDCAQGEPTPGLLAGGTEIDLDSAEP